MNIYSDFIFHFTGKNNNGLEILANILKSGFRFSNKNPVMPIGLSENINYYYNPGMICFTDIPLKKIPDHAKKYGNYGIGLRKEWGIKAGGQPVLYTFEESLFHKSLKQLHDTIEKLDDRFTYNGLIHQFWLAFDGLHGITQGNSSYDDREWRIVRDEKNQYQIDNVSMPENAIVETLKFKAYDIVLLVAPEKEFLELKKIADKIFIEKGEEVIFPIIPFEYINGM